MYNAGKRMGGVWKKWAVWEKCEKVGKECILTNIVNFDGKRKFNDTSDPLPLVFKFKLTKVQTLR